MKEFDFIRHYLQSRKLTDANIILGIGDDAAILRPQSGFDWHISTDMMVSGCHFFPDVAPQDLAHKLLAVNLSDMAAMGATPKYALLSAALPDLNNDWLEAFCSAFFAMADDFGVSLIGGDTTQGAGVFNLTIMGQTPTGKGLKRNAAQMGDEIWVSGILGLAAAALASRLQGFRLPENCFAICEEKLLRPIPRVALGQDLLDLAHAAQDISDGLWQDLEHITTASGVGATIFADDLPMLDDLNRHPENLQWALTGGDDYELIFTASADKAKHIQNLSQKHHLPMTRIGKITQGQGVRVLNQHQQEIHFKQKGFNHFEKA